MATASTPLIRATTTAEIEAEVVTAVEIESGVTIARETETEREVEVETEIETATGRVEIGAETETAAERGSTLYPILIILEGQAAQSTRRVATLAEETVGLEIGADSPMLSRPKLVYHNTGTIGILRDTDTGCSKDGTHTTYGYVPYDTWDSISYFMNAQIRFVINDGKICHRAII